MTLDKFPDAEDFYKNYWDQKPFVVRGAIDKEVIESLIDGDTLAGLSLEEDVKSRLMIKAAGKNEWACEHGPFADDRFATLGIENWSLLVQNVEQYHIETSQLLKEVHFSPRWMMDDIMVSYSAPGGSVGPHTDSYHVFLVQGIGKRKWKLSRAPINDDRFIDDMDLKVLKDGFDGDEYDVEMGDVIYIPPHFAHEGVTMEEAMTFSVGFLVPTMSELLVEYAQYLEQLPRKKKRYAGHGLDCNSAGFSVSLDAQRSLQSDLINMVQSDDFSQWMACYFSTPTHDDADNLEQRDEQLSSAQLRAALEEGQCLYKPEYVKIAMTSTASGTLNLSVYGRTVSCGDGNEKIFQWLNQTRPLSLREIQAMEEEEAAFELLTNLYNQGVISLKN